MGRPDLIFFLLGIDPNRSWFFIPDRDQKIGKDPVKNVLILELVLPNRSLVFFLVSV